MVSGVVSSLAGGVAGGAIGRAAGGAIRFTASLLTGGVRRGRQKIERDLSKTRDGASRTNARFQQLDETTKDLQNRLTAAGAAGAAGITAMVQNAPALADEFAKMRNTSRQLGFTLGRAVEPIFTELAENTLPALLNFVEKNEDAIKSFSSNVASALNATTDLATTIAGSTPGTNQGVMTPVSQEQLRSGDFGGILQSQLPSVAGSVAGPGATGFLNFFLDTFGDVKTTLDQVSQYRKQSTKTGNMSVVPE